MPSDTSSFSATQQALQLLGELFHHLILPFVQITLSLHEQLKHLSAAARLATFLFTLAFNNAHNRAMPSLTYCDIILMVKNIYFCIAKVKVHKPTGLF